MGFKIECPNCGSRSYREYWFGGEVRPSTAEGLDLDYERVWLRANVDGLQLERWFHFAGCRRWTTIERDTHDNTVVGPEQLR